MNRSQRRRRTRFGIGMLFVCGVFAAMSAVSAGAATADGVNVLQGATPATVAHHPTAISADDAPSEGVALGAVLGVAGTLAGVFTTSLLARSRDKRLQRERAVSTTVGLYATIWIRGVEGGVALRKGLRDATLQLRAAGIGPELRTAFARVTAACWWDGEQQHAAAATTAIEGNLLNLRDDLEKAVVEQLLRLGSRRSRQGTTCNVLSRARGTTLTLPEDAYSY